jgi:quinol monooxygenase YgiN
MSQPFIFIGTHRIKEGKFEDFRNSYQDLVKVVEAKEPRLIAFNCYANDDETEVSVVQVHPDADSMLFHMQVAREHIEQGVAGLLDVGSMQIYGTPSDAAVEMMKQLAGQGVPLIVKPQGLGGFTRSVAEGALSSS